MAINTSGQQAQSQRSYHSYLLRLWQERNGSHLQWRASLQSAQTGEKYHFASLEALFAFIRRRGIALNQLSNDNTFPGSTA